MQDSPLKKLSAVGEYRRALTGVVAALLLANLLIAVRHPDDAGSRVAIQTPDGTAPGHNTPAGTNGADPSQTTSVNGVKQAAPGSVPTSRGGIVPKPGTFVPGYGTIPLGITDKKIKVLYYWKGDQAMSSSTYLHGTGQEGNLDEGEAFRRLVQYVNKHANGGATFMGSTFNLHGRTIEPIVVESGKDSAIAAMTQDIVKKHKPFAAISSHGSISVTVCPALAKTGIFNFGTYDLGGRGGTLSQRSRGYCVPQATSWETQVDHSIEYLKRQQATSPYRDSTGKEQPRVYGVVYASYEGLVDSAPKAIARMRAAGLNIPKDAVVILHESTTTAASQGTNFVNQLRLAGVNTIIAPDSGAPISFTHASESNAFFPDWYVWPCSGEDSTGMVRLYNAHQWERAAGLTCYDAEFNADLLNDDQARKTEWYKQYQEVAPGYEPPAPTALVYQSMLPLLIGLTNAGPQVTVEKFQAGMRKFAPYRYSATNGKTTDPKSLLLSIGRRDLVGDLAKVRWDKTKPAAGGLSGQYVYPENRRYGPGATY